MWVRFVRFSRKIFASRRAFYFHEGTSYDLPPDWCAEWIADGSAVAILPPASPPIRWDAMPPSLGDERITVACVHKTGGVYDRVDYVGALADAVRRNLDAPHDFVCLTDAVKESNSAEGVMRIPLLHRWPGFWSKIELFRPGLFAGPVLYFDLDTVICGDITDIALAASPLVLTWDMQRGWINSSMLRWSVDLSFIYRTLASAAEPRDIMRRYESGSRWGDQGLIQDCLESRAIGWDWAQLLFPERINWHPPANRDQPALSGTSVSLWYGHPKPHEISSEFIATHWRSETRRAAA